MGENNSKKYLAFRRTREAEKCLDRKLTGIPYHEYIENKEEIDKRRALERAADKLLGKYRYGALDKQKHHSNRWHRKHNNISESGNKS